MAESNQFYIDKYQDYDKIIETNFQTIENGKLVEIKEIINPLKIDNRQLVSMPDNQNDTPHCSGYSIANIFESIYWKKTGKLKNLNAEQIYAKAKELDGRINTNGTQLYYAIQAAINLCGVEDTCKFDRVKIEYDTLVETIKFLIHKYDFLHASFAIHTGWFKCTKSDYIIKDTEVFVGYHAVVLVGYDEFGVYIQNSWGKNWGAKGFCVLPWNDVLKNISTLYWITF